MVTAIISIALPSPRSNCSVCMADGRPDLYALVGSHTALDVAFDATDVLTVRGDEPFLLTENTF